LSIFGLSFNDLGRYTQHPPYKAIKLHGSVNWVHPTRLPVVDFEQFSPLEIAHHMIANKRKKYTENYNKEANWPSSPPPTAA
jgi:hypothetical protein